MKLTIDNLGKIIHSELELNDLTILVGDNNAGKTYITYSIYGLLDNWRDFVNYNSFGLIEKKLKSDGQIILNKEEIINLITKSIISESERFQERIKDLFNDKEGQFANAKVELNFDKPTSFKNAERKVQIGESIIFEGKVEDNTLSMSYTKQNDSVLDERLFKRVIGDMFSSLVFDDIFPEPVIITAERLGISLFYKELDATRNSLIDGLQKLNEKDSNMHPFELLMSMTAYYATPIRDHISFTRDIEKIKKYNPKIDSTYPMEIIKEILGAEFKKENNQDIRFYTKRKKNNRFDIPLYLASSSARCIVDIYFYLNHIAKEGDILIIDEPESHLTLRNQRLMAKLLVSLINLKIKVFITTHSDFLVKEINNFILLSNPFEGKDNWLNKHKFYSEKDKIESSQVSVYQAKEGILENLVVTKKGIEIPFFDEEINHLFSISSDLDYLID
ncbi:MAG: ATP-binding protein [Arcicella sp.]|jgi:energy-coupling factor transporter ATP-binding protein EcfA2|nr:ATP-binding protein [Arcicella sp.]